LNNEITIKELKHLRQVIKKLKTDTAFIMNNKNQQIHEMVKLTTDYRHQLVQHGIKPSA